MGSITEKGDKSIKFLGMMNSIENTSYHKKKIMLHCYLIDRAPHVTGTTISGVSNYIVTSSRLQKNYKRNSGKAKTV